MTNLILFRDVICAIEGILRMVLAASSEKFKVVLLDGALFIY